MSSEKCEVEGKAGEPVALPVAGGPATGYAWVLDLPEGVERVEDGPMREVPVASRLGAAAGGHLCVKAALCGDYIIKARLARPWESGEAVRTLVIGLRIRD